MGPANDTSNTGRLWTWFTRHAKWVHQDVDKEVSHHYYWSGNARFHSLFRRCAKNGQTGSLPDKLNSTQRIRDPRCCGVGKGHISGVGKSLVNRKGQVRLGAQWKLFMKTHRTSDDIFAAWAPGANQSLCRRLEGLLWENCRSKWDQQETDNRGTKHGEQNPVEFVLVYQGYRAAGMVRRTMIRRDKKTSAVFVCGCLFLVSSWLTILSTR